MDGMATAKQNAERTYESETAESTNQVPLALKQLMEAIERIDHQASRLMDKCSRALAPESMADMTAKLGSVPREPLAPIVVDIEGSTERLGKIADQLADAANRMQL